MLEFLDLVFGIEEEQLTWWQMSIRAVVVFLAALLMIRLGNKRIFGKSAAFDIVLGIIYGSILSRAITGNSPFIPTVVAALVLVLLHRLLAHLAFKTSGPIGDFVKGKPRELIKDGKMQDDALLKSSLTENDLKEAIRKTGSKADLDKIDRAYLERSGNISVIMKDEEKED